MQNEISPFLEKISTQTRIALVRPSHLIFLGGKGDQLSCILDWEANSSSKGLETVGTFTQLLVR